MKEIIDSDQITYLYNSENGQPEIKKRGECYKPSGSIVYDFDEEKVVSFPIREYWLDIGRLSDYEQANNEYKAVFK